MATSAVPKKLSRTDLIKERERLEVERKRIDAEIAAQSEAELQGLVDAFKEHLAANDFSLKDALALLNGKTKARAKKGTASPKVLAYEVGLTYKNPKGDETWVGGTKGPKPKWLSALIEAGRTFESLAVKK